MRKSKKSAKPAKKRRHGKTKPAGNVLAGAKPGVTLPPDTVGALADPVPDPIPGPVEAEDASPPPHEPPTE
jgi:hypothetical protein